MLDPLQVEGDQLLIVVVGERVIGADLLERGDVSAAGVGRLDHHHVEEGSVRAAALGQLHNETAILAGTREARRHIRDLKRKSQSGTVDNWRRIILLHSLWLLGSSLLFWPDATGQN